MITLRIRSTIVSTINWDEFKKYKHERESAEKLDNFEMVIEFLRSFYNKSTSFEVFDTLVDDKIGKMMLEKRNISKPEGLDSYLYKQLSR